MTPTQPTQRPSRPWLRRPHRLVCAGLVGLAAVAGLSGLSPAAHADPTPVFPSQAQVDQAKAAAGAAAGQVAVLDQQLAASRAMVAELAQSSADAMEAASGARIALAQATAAAQAAEATARSARAQADQATLDLSRLAADVYASGGGGTGQLDVFFGDGGPQSVLDRAAGVEAVGAEQADLVDRAGAADHLAADAQQAAAEARGRQEQAASAAQAAADRAQQAVATAQTQTARLQAQQVEVTARLAALQRTSVALEQQRQAGLAAAAERAREEANRRAAAAAAAAAARQAAAQAAQRAAAQAAAARAATSARQQQGAQGGTSGTSGGSGGSSGSTSTPAPTPPPPPPSSGGVAAVLAYAYAQLGKPYVWGAAGPGAFDCSGLTMMAWAQAGVGLTHYTGSQYAETARVPISQLQPGDLVFYGTSGLDSHHVGLYIGGGMMIHAPNPSTVVKIASIYSMSDLVPYGGRP